MFAALAQVSTPTPAAAAAAQAWPVWSCGAWPENPGGRFEESRWWDARPGAAEERCLVTAGRARLHIAGGTVVAIHVTMAVAAGHEEEAAQVLDSLAGHTRKEAGCLSYSVARAGSTFTVTEMFMEEGHAAHSKQPHMAPFRAFKGDFAKYHDMSQGAPRAYTEQELDASPDPPSPRHLKAWPSVVKTTTAGGAEATAGAGATLPAGGPVVVKAGDWVVFRKGFLCTWHVDESIAKHYAYFDADGRAWSA